MLYRLARPFLFRMDPEDAHQRVLSLLERLGRHPRLQRTVAGRFVVDDPVLETEALGLSFPNPLGMAAGFDKDARLANVLPSLGFGFVEVGTVTAEPQPGNPPPRLFRYPEHRALVNRLGFNNEGSETVAKRLGKAGRPGVPLGVNLGKSKVTPLDEAEKDYLASFERFHPLADYLVVNVSSPNTPGLRDLQAAEHLDGILRALQQANDRLSRDAGIARRPLLVKVSPDLALEDLDDVVRVARDRQVAGLVAVNTTVAREGLPDVQEEGGLSGVPLRERATQVVAHLHQATGGAVPIVGVGGIQSGADALERLEAGASLLQIYTGFIYGGPGAAARINRDLARRLRGAGVEHVDEVVGRRSAELAP